MRVSYEEDLANSFGLQRRDDSHTGIVLSVRARGKKDAGDRHLRRSDRLTHGRIEWSFARASRNPHRSILRPLREDRPNRTSDTRQRLEGTSEILFRLPPVALSRQTSFVRLFARIAVVTLFSFKFGRF